jgi:hypothetical protein
VIFPHPAGNQLVVLGPEINDEYHKPDSLNWKAGVKKPHSKKNAKTQARQNLP